MVLPFEPWIIAVAFLVLVAVSLPPIILNNKKKLAQYEQQRREWAQSAGWTYHGEGAGEVLKQFPAYPFDFPGLRNPTVSLYATGQVAGRSAGLFDYFYSVQERTRLAPYTKSEIEVTSWPRTATAYLQLAQPVPTAFVESTDPPMNPTHPTGLPIPESQIFLDAERGRGRDIYIATADPRWAATLAHPALLDLLAQPENHTVQVLTVNSWLVVLDAQYPAHPPESMIELLQQVHGIIGRL